MVDDTEYSWMLIRDRVSWIWAGADYKYVAQAGKVIDAKKERFSPVLWIAIFIWYKLPSIPEA